MEKFAFFCRSPYTDRRQKSRSGSRRIVFWSERISGVIEDSRRLCWTQRKITVNQKGASDNRPPFLCDLRRVQLES